MTIEIYGTQTCADCLRVKQFLNSKNIGYEFYAIENDSKYLDKMNSLAPGNKSVPVVVVDDKIYIEPSNQQLLDIFN